MPIAPRPPFRRGVPYIAIRPIRLTSKVVLEPGEKVDLPSHRLRSLFQRRRVGPAGHPWTEAMLGTEGFPTDWYSTDKAEGAVEWPLLWPATRVVQIPEHNMIFLVAELAEVVDEAYEESGIDQTFVTDSEEDREIVHDAFVATIKAELDDMLVEDDETPDDAGVQEPEDVQEPEQPVEAAEKPEPVKVGSQWTIPGLTEEKFTSKKKALAWLEAEEDGWLEGGED